MKYSIRIKTMDGQENVLWFDSQEYWEESWKRLCTCIDQKSGFIQRPNSATTYVFNAALIVTAVKMMRPA